MCAHFIRARVCTLAAGHLCALIGLGDLSVLSCVHLLYAMPFCYYFDSTYMYACTCTIVHVVTLVKQMLTSEAHLCTL